MDKDEYAEWRKRITFTELREYVAQWELDNVTPEVCFGIPMCLGLLDREDLDKQDEEDCYFAVLELVEKNPHLFYHHFMHYMSGSYLEQLSQGLADDPDEDSADQWLHARDSIQLAVSTLEPTFRKSGPHMDKLEDYLFMCDSLVAVHKSIVRMVQSMSNGQLGADEMDIDKNRFWWFDATAEKDDDDCWIPERMRQEYICRYIDNKLHYPGQRERLDKHRETCERCNMVFEITQELITKKL